MTYNADNKPEDLRVEYALLTWWKCNLVEMPGIGFQHARDYKAVITLFKKFIESLNPSNDWDAVTKDLCEQDLKRAEDAFVQEEYEWYWVDDIRNAVHNYLGYIYDKLYCPDSDGLPPSWGAKRIAELTDS